MVAGQGHDSRRYTRGSELSEDNKLQWGRDDNKGDRDDNSVNGDSGAVTVTLLWGSDSDPTVGQ